MAFWVRLAGLKSVVEHAEAQMYLEELDPHGLSYESAHDAANRYLDTIETWPDAIFTWNDTAAMAFVSAFRDAGANIPADLSIVGYNDIPAAQYFSPRITTIRQDTHQAGRVLAAKLLRIIDGETPKSTLIRTDLIHRET